MEDGKKVSEIINPISSSLEDLRIYLERVEKGLDWKIKYRQGKALREDRAELKIEDLLFASEFGRIKINSIGGTFEMNKFTIKNCKYKNILWDEIENSNDHEIYLDYSCYYVEILLDLIRLFQKPREIDKKIKNITECLNYNDIENYSEPKFNLFKKTIRVPKNDQGATDEDLINVIKEFFYERHLTIFEKVHFIGYKIPKNTINLKNPASFKN
jgi:hypothetical protein